MFADVGMVVREDAYFIISGVEYGWWMVLCLCHPYIPLNIHGIFRVCPFVLECTLIEMVVNTIRYLNLVCACTRASAALHYRGVVYAKCTNGVCTNSGP